VTVDPNQEPIFEATPTAADIAAARPLRSTPEEHPVDPDAVTVREAPTSTPTARGRRATPSAVRSLLASTLWEVTRRRFRVGSARPARRGGLGATAMRGPGS
jgi:hypothetical protein